MIQVSSASNAKICSPNTVSPHRKTPVLIERMFQKLSRIELLGKEQVFICLRQGWQMNHKQKSLSGKFRSLELFLVFCSGQGKRRLDEIVREDLEGFVEHVQDQGSTITTARTRLKHVMAFIRFLADQDLVSERILKRKIKPIIPDALPRAINLDDVRAFISVIKKIRDRAMFLVLLRTGMRIGELLNTKIMDLDLRERKIHIYEGEKNALGRVVYLSDDALFALRLWLSKRDSRNEMIFYGQKEGQPICYSTARSLFMRYQKKAGLLNKKYTIHSLRHTFATDLLNAGMRLECVQHLLGHHHIEMTRRYARLTEKSREEEYFRAMRRIEQGDLNGNS